MDMIFAEIENTLRSNNYFSAITTALLVPDICGALGSNDGVATGAKFRQWYDENLAAQYESLTAVDCYSLRCGVVHQGRFGGGRGQYARVLFTVPNAQNNTFHRIIINDCLNLDAIRFCTDVVNAGRHWFAQNQTDANVVANLPRLVQFRPDGLPPYMIGMPLIA
ncbi:hypothetical protein GCM10007242_16340 [Pigmentiphaga litoralis]|uniref:hypothetical protein n=1 Tax=Pigmentiphaga litoralis TaxID=516702 RepID=UPI0016769662|nr:hypothetical protein [Pigmentiphaga litoralis]GGX11044.1 hypothetical protein GCM10007242_16340 [Pigmentiphaga litoralis]